MMKIRLKIPKSIFDGLDNTVLPTVITFLAKIGRFWYAKNPAKVSADIETNSIVSYFDLRNVLSEFTVC